MQAQYIRVRHIAYLDLSLISMLLRTMIALKIFSPHLQGSTVHTVLLLISLQCSECFDSFRPSLPARPEGVGSRAMTFSTDLRFNCSDVFVRNSIRSTDQCRPC